MGLRVEGLGLRMYGLQSKCTAFILCRASSLPCLLYRLVSSEPCFLGLGLRAWSFGIRGFFRASGLGLRARGSGLRAKGLLFRV